MRRRGPSFSRTAASAALLAAIALSAGACKGGGVTAESFPVDTAAPPIKKEDAKPLLAKFAKAQLDERKALLKKQQGAMSQLQKDQKEEFRLWETDSKKRLVDFRHEHRGDGKKVRAEMRNERQKRSVFIRVQADTLKRAKESQDKERRSLQAFQDANLEMFKAHLEKSLRPPATLWPAGTAPY